MTAALTDQEFRLRSDEALEGAQKALLELADSNAFEVELQDGVLSLFFDEPTTTRFVVSPNAPARQIWVSAMARGYKLTWSPQSRTFVLGDETLVQLLARLTQTFLRSD
jgi:CyaY protein